MDGKEIGINGWKVVRTIGKGGFGSVYEVEKDDGIGGVIRSALKVISIPEPGADITAYRDDGYDDASLTELFKSQVEDITSEFRLMNKLKGCSNIVSFEDYSIIQHNNEPGYDIYIRMELLTPLPRAFEQELSKTGVIDDTVRRLGVDICRALELCSHYKIIHRDIKPQNIFVNELGDFKLGDFGIAKTSDHTTRATKTGTFGYMAPEVYLSKPYNASVDIYSLGLVMYWMLNERRGPFLPLPPAVPKPSQNAEALDRRMSGEPLPAPKHGSEELKRIVLKACAYDPKDRYSSPEEMRGDLEQLTDTILGSVSVGETASVETRILFDEGDKTVGLFEQKREEKRILQNTDVTIAVLPNEQTNHSKPKYCSQCGKIQEPGTQFCTACGAPQIVVEKQNPEATVMIGTVPNDHKAGTMETASYVQSKLSGNRNKCEDGNETRKKRWIIPTAACAVLLLALIIVIALVWGKRTPASKPAEDSSLTLATEETYTLEQTEETIPTPTPTTTPTPTPVCTPYLEVYFIDDYFNDKGYLEGGTYLKRYADDYNRDDEKNGLKYMWKTCYFGQNGEKHNGSIIVDGQPRKNALAIEYEGSSYDYDSSIRQKYGGGYIELQNPNQYYDTLEFGLGALSDPVQWYGPANTNGYYRMIVQVDGIVQVETEWLDCYQNKHYTINIAGANTIRFYFYTSVGSTGGSPNLGMYDMRFTKTH